LVWPWWRLILQLQLSQLLLQRLHTLLLLLLLLLLCARLRLQCSRRCGGSNAWLLPLLLHSLPHTHGLWLSSSRRIGHVSII
jgi:hypothetical protein